MEPLNKTSISDEPSSLQGITAKPPDLLSESPAVVHGFTLVDAREEPYVGGRAALYRHVDSGAEILSLENNHSNKCFRIAFQTPAFNSTGVQHIIEHSVLNGSASYPVKNLFNEILKSSLKTELNASTHRTYTQYEVGSKSLVDFHNLVKVYLDVVFNPLLLKETFETQGWRYVINSDGKLDVAGIVLNEMKGTANSANRVIFSNILEGLYPDTQLHKLSFGDPREIIKLSFEDLKEYHKTYYSPANARLVFFGNDPVEDRLRIANDFLSSVPKGEAYRYDSKHEPFSSPKYIECSYPFSGSADLERSVHVVLAWGFPEGLSAQESFDLSMLDKVLLNNDNSPLFKALFESQIGTNVFSIGHTSNIPLGYFAVGVKGTSFDKAQDLEKLVFSTLEGVVGEGVSNGQIESVLNRIEYSVRMLPLSPYAGAKIVSDDIIPAWTRGYDALASCSQLSMFNNLKERLSHGEKVFENLIERRLIGNSHRITLTAKPDPLAIEKNVSEERAVLDDIESKLTPQEKNRISERDRELHEFIGAPDPEESLQKIPRLKISDIDPIQKELEVNIHEVDGVVYLAYPADTNGVISTEMYYEASDIPQHLLTLLPLFSSSLTNLGTHRQSYAEFSERIDREIGGIGYQPIALRESITGDTRIYLKLGGTVIVEHLDKLTQLIKESFSDTNWSNRELLLLMLNQKISSFEQSIERSGDDFAQMRLQSQLYSRGSLVEKFHGIEQLKFLKEFRREVESDWTSAAGKLSGLSEIFQGKKPAFISTCAPGHVLQFAEESFRQVFGSLNQTQNALKKPYYSGSLEYRNEALILPCQMNFVAMSLNIDRVGYRHHSSALVASQILNNEWLTSEVREKGNAYGVFSYFDLHSKSHMFSSYRDPHIQRTLEVFKRSGDFLQNLSFNQEELERFIIAAMSSFDAPYSIPTMASNATERYVRQRPLNIVQTLRTELLSTTLDDIKKFGQYLSLASSNPEVAAMGSETAIDSAKGIFAKKVRIFD